MPGAAAKTSIIVLSNTTLEYGILLANKGLEVVVLRNKLKLGINTYKGFMTNKAVAESLGYEYNNYDDL